MTVQIQQSRSASVPSLAGVGGFVHQSGMASISDRERVRIMVEEITGSVIRSWYLSRTGERSDVTCDVPAGIRGDYNRTVQYWADVVSGWAPAAPLAIVA